MRSVRALAAAALAAAALVVVPAEVASAVVADVVAVVPDGTPARTAFATDVGATYQITVTGAYSYNGRQNLADCGWWNPEWAGDAWFPGDTFRLDGSPAACTSQPYTTTHTYTWTQPGTGAPFTFHVYDSLPWDNIGSLVVSVVEVSPATRLGPVECSVARVVRDSELDMLLVHVVLRVPVTGAALYVQGECRLVGERGTAATIYAYGASPEAVGTDVVPLPDGPYQACASAWAFFVDGRDAWVDETCRAI
ncbi:MAG TPA: hypothetical protein VNA20_00360 [Frankiaceae bacterium]|nr:hypothetical protein [Frankiaceae bacterium]